MEVIRKNVFETNSSSTHSVSLAYYTDDDLKKGKFPDCTVRIVSPLYKTIFLHGLIRYNSTHNGTYNKKKNKVEYDEPSPALLHFYNGCRALLSAQIGVPEEQLDDYFHKTLFGDESEEAFCRRLTGQGYSQEAAAEQYKRFQEKPIFCEDFFGEGCLDDCFCGFDSMLALTVSLPLYSEEPLTPEEFFSPHYAFVLCEKYAGCMPVNNNKEL